MIFNRNIVITIYKLNCRNLLYLWLPLYSNYISGCAFFGVNEPKPSRKREEASLSYQIRPIKQLFVSVCLIITVLILSSCSQGITSQTDPSSNGPITIGMSLPLSGDFSQDGLFTKQGYELWAETVNKNGGLNGRQIRLDIVSDASDPAKATTAYRKLITVDHVDLLLGPFGFEVVPAAQVAQQYKFPLINGTGTTPDVFQAGLTNIFTVSLTSTRYLTSYAYYILSLPESIRPKTATYVTANDTFTEPLVASVRKILEANGIQTTGGKGNEILYKDETTDFTPIAQKIIQARGQIVIMGSLGVQDTGAFVQAFKQQHYNPLSVIAASGPDQGDAFLKGVGGAQSAEGFMVPNGGWWPESTAFQNAQFVKDYIAKYGGTPGSISSDTVQAYSSGQVLQEAVDKVHSTDKTKLMQVLHSGATWETLQGIVKFAPDGENTAAVPFLFQWQGGKLIPVFPTSNAAANPEFPKPNWP